MARAPKVAAAQGPKPSLIRPWIDQNQSVLLFIWAALVQSLFNYCPNLSNFPSRGGFSCCRPEGGGADGTSCASPLSQAEVSCLPAPLQRMNQLRVSSSANGSGPRQSHEKLPAPVKFWLLVSSPSFHAQKEEARLSCRRLLEEKLFCRLSLQEEKRASCAASISATNYFVIGFRLNGLFLPVIATAWGETGRGPVRTSWQTQDWHWGRTSDNLTKFIMKKQFNRMKQLANQTVGRQVLEPTCIYTQTGIILHL